MGELLKIAGGAAGLAGMALIVFMYIARDFIKENVFRGLGKTQAYRLWRNLIWVLLIVTIVSILAWLASVLFAPKAVSVMDVAASLEGRTGNNVMELSTACPVTVRVTGEVTAEGTGYVKYQFVRKVSVYGEELYTEPQTIHFNGALKTISVYDNVPVPYNDLRSYYFSDYLRILEPGNRDSEPVGFTIMCNPDATPAPSNMPPPPQLTPGVPPPPG